MRVDKFELHLLMSGADASNFRAAVYDHPNTPWSEAPSWQRCHTKDVSWGLDFLLHLTWAMVLAISNLNSHHFRVITVDVHEPSTASMGLGQISKSSSFCSCPAVLSLRANWVNFMSTCGAPLMYFARCLALENSPAIGSMLCCQHLYIHVYMTYDIWYLMYIYIYVYIAFIYEYRNICVYVYMYIYIYILLLIW